MRQPEQPAAVPDSGQAILGLKLAGLALPQPFDCSGSLHNINIREPPPATKANQRRNPPGFWQSPNGISYSVSLYWQEPIK